MNLVVIVLLAALVVVLAIIVNSKTNHKEEEAPEPLVNPNFGVELESPAAPVVAPEEEIVVDKAKIKKAVKSPAVVKSAKTVAKTTAKAAPKKTVTKKSK